MRHGGSDDIFGTAPAHYTTSFEADLFCWDDTVSARLTDLHIIPTVPTSTSDCKDAADNGSLPTIQKVQYPFHPPPPHSSFAATYTPARRIASQSRTGKYHF